MGFFEGHDARQADLHRPGLTHELVDVAADVGVGILGMFFVGFMDEILAVVELLHQGLRAAFGDGGATLGKKRVVHLSRHRLAGA